MSFRFEEKIRLLRNKKFIFEKWLAMNSAKEIFPPRTVNSIYFDNFTFSIYKDSLEGTVPRKKIRIRTYNSNSINFEQLENLKLEYKISSSEGRYKIQKNINYSLNEYLKRGIFDLNYGNCFPVLEVKYKRQYFIVNKFRITLDTNICFKKIIKDNLSLSNFKELNSNVVEIKYPEPIEKSFVSSEIPFPRSRFSKYCYGVENLNIL